MSLYSFRTLFRKNTNWQTRFCLLDRLDYCRAKSVCCHCLFHFRGPSMVASHRLNELGGVLCGKFICSNYNLVFKQFISWSHSQQKDFETKRKIWTLFKISPPECMLCYLNKHLLSLCILFREFDPSTDLMWWRQAWNALSADPPSRQSDNWVFISSFRRVFGPAIPVEEYSPDVEQSNSGNFSQKDSLI